MTFLGALDWDVRRDRETVNEAYDEMHSLSKFSAVDRCVTCILIQSEVSTSQDPNNQRATEEYRARYHLQLDRADAAWDREMAREKAGDCEGAGKRGQQPYNTCLANEVQATTANYRDDVMAFRQIFFEPSGRPLSVDEAVKRLDEVEASFAGYLRQMCSLNQDRWRPDSIAPNEGSRCELALIRNHMRELRSILGFSR
jgi:hypothetical protein